MATSYHRHEVVGRAQCRHCYQVHSQQRAKGPHAPPPHTHTQKKKCLTSLSISCMMHSAQNHTQKLYTTVWQPRLVVHPSPCPTGYVRLLFTAYCSVGFKGEVHNFYTTSWLLEFEALSRMVEVRGSCDKPFKRYSRLKNLLCERPPGTNS